MRALCNGAAPPASQQVEDDRGCSRAGHRKERDRTMKSLNLAHAIRGGLVVLLLWSATPTAGRADESAPRGPDGEALETTEQLAERLRSGFESEPDLSRQEREELRRNLEAMLELGLSDAHIRAAFGEAGSQVSVEARLQIQDRILAMLREGISPALVVDKLAEGETKRAREAVIREAVLRMETRTREAHRFVAQLRQEGGREHGAADGVRLELGIALDLWRGLRQEDLDRLRARARDRLRDGSCDLTHLAAAAETTTELMEAGADRDKAVELCGNALERGYSGIEMRQLGRMLMVAQTRGYPIDEVLEDVGFRVRSREPLGSMMQHMMFQGWMGPESMGGWHGGERPVDHVIGGSRHGGRPGS